MSVRSPLKGQSVTAASTNVAAQTNRVY